LLPQAVRADPNRLMLTMAVTIIRHFFGEHWCEDHIIQDAAQSRPAGFLRFDFTPGFDGERKTSRVLEFAETLSRVVLDDAAAVPVLRRVLIRHECEFVSDRVEVCLA